MWAQHQVCPSPVHQTRVSVRPEPAQPQGEARPAPGLWAAVVVQGKPPHTSPHHMPSVCTGLGILGLHGPLSSLREFSDPHCLLGTNLDVRAWGTGFPSRSLFLGCPVIKPGVTCGWVRRACPAHRGLKAVPAASHSLRERGGLPDGLQDPWAHLSLRI